MLMCVDMCELINGWVSMVNLWSVEGGRGREEGELVSVEVAFGEEGQGK